MRKNAAAWFTAEVHAEMHRLWLDGVTTKVMAQHFGVTKNQIIRQSRHLDVPRRASPIVRQYGPPPPAAPKPPRVMPTLLALPSESLPTESLPTVAARPVWVPPPPPVRMALAPVAPPTVIRRQVDACCWPTRVGSPGRLTWLYCGADALRRKPYCADHDRLAYLPGKKQLTEADA